MKTKLAKIILFSLLLLLPVTVFAFQPQLTLPSSAPIKIKDPEVTTGYYGHLAGQPQEFEIVTDDSFDVFIQIMVPDVAGSRKDFRLIGTNVSLGQEWFDIDGVDLEWESYYEEYGQNNYLQGPQFGGSAQAGTYRIKVTNPDDRGAYILVVGARKGFPLGEAINTIRVLPSIRQDYFGESSWSALGTPYLYGPIVLLLVLFGIIVWLARR